MKKNDKSGNKMRKLLKYYKQEIVALVGMVVVEVVRRSQVLYVILRVESSEFADGLDVGAERRRLE